MLIWRRYNFWWSVALSAHALIGTSLTARAHWARGEMRVVALDFARESARRASILSESFSHGILSGVWESRARRCGDMRELRFRFGA